MTCLSRKIFCKVSVTFIGGGFTHDAPFINLTKPQLNPECSDLHQELSEWVICIPVGKNPNPGTATGIMIPVQSHSGDNSGTEVDLFILGTKQLPEVTACLQGSRCSAESTNICLVS